MHCAFSAVRSFYSDCSRSNIVPTEVKGIFGTDFEGIWSQPLETCPVQILKWVHCEKHLPDAEKRIQWVTRSAHKQTQSAGSCSEGTRLRLSPAGWVLSPPSRTRGLEVSCFTTFRCPHKTPLVKLGAEISPWSTELSPAVTGSG